MNVVWFKRDLRTSDHRALADAAASGAALPLYVVEPELWRQPDASARQWSFVHESLTELSTELASLGQPLVIRVGSVVDVLAALHLEKPISALHSHEETGNGLTYGRDLAVADWCRRHGIAWHEYSQNGVQRPHPRRDGWARRRQQRLMTPLVHPPAALAPVRGIRSDRLPDAAELGLDADACPERQLGGRRQALTLLESFLVERAEPYRRAMSGPASGRLHCSRLSPHLAWGTVSMKEVTQATQRRREQVAASRETASEWRASLKAFESRLSWHCHFMQKLEDEPTLEFQNLHRGYDGLRPSSDDSSVLDAWRKGETGLPFLDACMRSLQATGWINFRMRAMLMSFASYQLWLDWRLPGEHLARLFTDYEPGIHWPQVQMQSGTTGINATRIYNPVKQGYDQDAGGEFIRRWIPELRRVPAAFLHEPWRWPDARQVLDKRYPAPIVEHRRAAETARRRIHAVRADGDHRDVAQAVFKRHGSRRRSGQRHGPGSRQEAFELNGETKQ